MGSARSPEPGDVGERDLLRGWLAFHRDALAAKCDGVSGDDLIRSGLGGSTMSLLGLIRHLTEMERVVKLLQEYARHNGHADLIRQAVDGTTGD